MATLKIGDPIPGTDLTYDEADIANLQNSGESIDQSPTTISNATTIEDTIPDLKDRLKGLTESVTGIQKTAEELQAQEKTKKEEPTQEIGYEKAGTTPTGEQLFLDPDTGLIETADQINRRKLERQSQEAPPETPDEKKQSDLMASMKENLDAQTKSQISAIEQQFAVRKQQQAEINRRLGEARSQSLLMGGSSRYAQLSAEGVQSAQSTAGLLAIAQLDAEEKDLIAKAQNAQQQGDFKIMEKELDLAETKRKEKQTAASELAKKTAEKNNKLKENLNKIVEQTEKDITDILKDAGKNNAPAEVIDAISKAQSVSEAVKAAGSYLRTAGGTMGEWITYNRERKAKDLSEIGWDEYATADANRKASATSNAGAGLNSKQQTILNGVINKYFASDGLKALFKASNMQGIINDIEKNPEAAGTQLALIYSFIKVLDTDSAVREGEIGLVSSLDSFLGNFGKKLENIVSNPAKPITRSTALEIAREAKNLINNIKNTADKRLRLSTAQINANRDENLKSSWQDFITEVNDIYSDIGGTGKVIEEI